jgi:hypothetical protein
MRIEATLWGVSACFYVVAGIAYWVLAGDPAGITVLLVASLFGGVGGSYAWVWRRRVGDRAQDVPEATMLGNAGEVGYFPASSVWPLPIAAGLTLLALGPLFGLWVAVPGASLLALGALRLLDESMHKAARG